MLVDSSRIPAVRIFEAPVFPDERGFLLQSWVATDLAARGLPREFKQAIQTCSRRGVMRGLRWNDPALAIAWPAMPTIVSEKDRVAPTLAEWLADPRAQHFRYV